ncbi:hypothetical protein [Pseudarthrobacter sp. S9]|uniref:hypothetical protein n=1 Tax=Pseudarthrobacter sp. S9 TaxID=3418421 RepID=UPI003CFEE7B9
MHRGITADRKRAGGIREHVDSCAECRAQQGRERQYLERLRGAPVPEASDDLTARLLARTEQLATERPTTERPVPDRGRRPEVRYVALLAGGTAAAMALMAGTAYLMGGDATPVADGAEASAFSWQDAPGSLVSGGSRNAGIPGQAESGTGIDWSLSGGPALTPAGVLTAGQLATLRSQGWTCPELRELGFHLIWARGGVISGADILELRLTDGRHFATVLEQHGALLPQDRPASGQQPAAPAPPVNVLTGHLATADGFTATEPDGAARAPESGSSTLWVNTATPYRAIYQTSAATFTYVSDLPAEQADDGVAALVRAGAATPMDATVGAPGPGGIPERMERGLGRILELLAP